MLHRPDLVGGWEECELPAAMGRTYFVVESVRTVPYS